MSSLALDRVVGIGVRAALSLLFLWAAAHKLRDRAGFRAALADYDLLPLRWLGTGAALLTVIEAALALGLLLPPWGTVAAQAAASLLALYAAAMLINLWRGRHDIDCGCVSGAGRHPIGAGLVVRNGVLVAAALISTMPWTARRLTWIDAVTMAAAVAASALLYAATDGMLAQAPHRAALARRRAGHDPIESHPEVAHA